MPTKSVMRKSNWLANANNRRFNPSGYRAFLRVG